jgi:hypothetical protein
MESLFSDAKSPIPPRHFEKLSEILNFERLFFKSNPKFDMKVYLLKTKGVGSVPDHIQVRAEDHSIIGYFKASNPNTGLKELGITEPERQEHAIAVFGRLEYGKIVTTDL